MANRKTRGSGKEKEAWFTYNPNSVYGHDSSEYETIHRRKRVKAAYKRRTSPFGVATGRKQTRRAQVKGKARYETYKRLKRARIVRKAKKKHGYNVYHANIFTKGRFYQVVMSVTWIKYNPGRAATYSKQRGYSDRRKLTDSTFLEAKEQAFYRAYQACPFSPDDYKKPVSVHFLYYKKQ